MKTGRMIRNEETGVSPVIATILMVAITVVLAAVLYVMVSGFLAPIESNTPLVTLDPTVTLSSGNATIEVTDSRPPHPPSSFRVNLQVEGQTGAAVAMPTTSGGVVSVVVAGTTYRISWTDLGGEGTVNDGDRFGVAGDGLALPPASSFTFFLLWNDGSLLASRSWTT